VRVEDFKIVPIELHLHMCPFKSLPPTVETKEILASLETLREMYPLSYSEEDKLVLPSASAPGQSRSSPESRDN
jgi:hypothetical protein